MEEIQNQPEVIITRHAYDRAKERFSLSKRSIERLAIKAFHQGTCHKNTVGRLKTWVDQVYLRYRNANNIRIFGDNVFFFGNATLITLYRIPNEYRRHLIISKKKQDNDNSINDT